MARLPDIGSFSNTETKELLAQCISELPLHEAIEVIVETMLAHDGAEELLAQLEPHLDSDASSDADEKE